MCSHCCPTYPITSAFSLLLPPCLSLCPAANLPILFLGRPGVGKTTAIREIARTLSDELRKRVVIVDTSNEIGGDGDVPHHAIGGARRMQVADASKQHHVMVSAATRCVRLLLFELPASGDLQPVLRTGCLQTAPSFVVEYLQGLLPAMAVLQAWICVYKPALTAEHSVLHLLLFCWGQPACPSFQL